VLGEKPWPGARLLDVALLHAGRILQHVWKVPRGVLLHGSTTTAPGSGSAVGGRWGSRAETKISSLPTHITPSSSLPPRGPPLAEPRPRRGRSIAISGLNIFSRSLSWLSRPHARSHCLAFPADTVLEQPTAPLSSYNEQRHATHDRCPHPPRHLHGGSRSLTFATVRIRPGPGDSFFR
jgi:hypothetical protein